MLHLTAETQEGGCHRSRVERKALAMKPPSWRHRADFPPHMDGKRYWCLYWGRSQWNKEDTEGWARQKQRQNKIREFAYGWEQAYGTQATAGRSSPAREDKKKRRKVRIDVQETYELIPSDLEYTVHEGRWLYTFKGPTRTPVSLRSLGVDLKDYMRGLRRSGLSCTALTQDIEADLNRPREPLITKRAKGVRVYATVRTGKRNKLASCLVDTGADRSVASFEFYEKLKSMGCEERELPAPVPMRGAAGGRLEATHGLFIQLRILPRTTPAAVWVLRAKLSTSVDILLGNTFCDSENLDVNCRHGTLTWNDGGYPRVTLGSIGSRLRRRRDVANKPGLLRVKPNSRMMETNVIPEHGGEATTSLTGTIELEKLAPLRGSRGSTTKGRRRRRERPKPRDNDAVLAHLNRLYVDCVQQGRAIELDWWNDEIEDHDDRIVDAAAKVQDDSIPVFSAGKGRGRLRVERRQAGHIPVFPLVALPAGKWVFEPTVRPKYAGKLLWPSVVVEVSGKGAREAGFGIPLCNVGETNARIAPGKLVGKMRRYDTVLDFENLGVDRTTELCAMETYEEFAADRTIVDVNDPVALANHQQKVWKTVKENVGRELTGEQEQSLREVVKQYAHIFSALKGQAPPVSEYGKLTPFTIETGDKPPISHRYVHRNPRKKKEIERHVQTMQRDGIIRDSTSSWASPVVLAMKKDGTTRFCVNYRPLNEISKRDRYPLPRIDEIMDRLGGQAWFSSLDMSAGYWVIPIAEKDKEKTAFISHMGLKEFNVMPFGLTNAPAAYQRAMDVVLAGLIGVNSLVYIDDVLVFSETFEDHIRDLTSVLVRLAAAGMTINARKCCLCRKELLYLGHVVTTEGVKPDPSKVRDIQNAQTPENLRQVRAFLGLVNYYRRYIPNCSVVQAPLTDMTKNAKKGEPPPEVRVDRAMYRGLDKIESRLGGGAFNEASGLQPPVYYRRGLLRRRSRCNTKSKVRGRGAPGGILQQKVYRG